MPARARVTKEMVLEAAFRLVRDKGYEALSVRAVAERLGCSTQPVVYNFASVDDLRREVYRETDEFHSCYIMPRQDCAENPLLQLGLNYIRFGAEERNLFRFLFQSNQFSGADLQDLMSDPALEPMLQLTCAEANCTIEAAREAFSLLFVVAHGMASLLANNAMAFDEPTCAALLRRAFASSTGGDPS